MNRVEKDRISELREIGYSYSRIADLLNVSRNTVQSYCRRNGLGGAASVQSGSDYCPRCGAPVYQTPGAKHKRFCSDRCRIAWWNAHPEAGIRRSVPACVCGFCGTLFQGYGNRVRKYCSRACSGKARAMQHD